MLTNWTASSTSLQHGGRSEGSKERVLAPPEVLPGAEGSLGGHEGEGQEHQCREGSCGWEALASLAPNKSWLDGWVALVLRLCTRA